MIRILFLFFLSAGIFQSCNNSGNEANQNTKILTNAEESTDKPVKRHFTGAFSNGMKGDSISFDVSADGKMLSNLTFKGYWRCSGRLESTTAGPEGVFIIIDNKVNDHISEPPNGGSTSWRFDLQADIKGDNAQGSFRMNINNLGCDSYKLMWTATGK